jgi:hypothetical protein
MKLLVVEGSPEELARLDALTGFFRHAAQHRSDRGPDDRPGEDDSQDPSSAAVVPQHVRDFIAKWATNPQRRELVEEFVARVLELGNAEVELGRSKKSPDGLNRYLMLRHIGIRRRGAAVYVAPHLGRARFHLPAKEAEGRTHARALEREGPYQVAAFLTSPAAVDEALELAVKSLEATAP